MSYTPKIATVLLGRGVNTIINLLFVPYLSRALPMTDYGTYGQTLLVVDFFKMLFALGLANVLIIHLAKYEDQHGKVLGSNLALGLLGGLLAIGLLYICADAIALNFENPQLTTYLRLYIWSVPFAILFDSLNTGLVYYDKIKQSVWILVIGNLLKVLLLVWAVQVMQSLTWVMAALLIATLVQVVLAWLAMPKKKIGKLGIHIERFKEQFKDGLPLGLSSMASILLNTVDGFMVSAMSSIEDYAIFRNGAIQIPFLDMLSYSIATILMPALAKLFQQNDKKQIIHLKKRIITQSAAILYPPVVFILFFYYPLIVAYLSPKYVDSAIVFLIFNLVMFLRINFYQDIPLVAQKNYFIFTTFIIGFLVNICLNWFLIPIYGNIGAAVSTLLSTTLTAALLFTKGLQILDSRFTEMVDLKKLFQILLISVTPAFLFWAIYQQFQSLPLIFVFGAIQVGICYFLMLKWQLLETNIALNLTKKFPFIGQKLTNLVHKIVD